MTIRTTLALRVCVSCGKGYGVALWPWNGQLVTRTHGLCHACFESLEQAFDDEREAPRRRARPHALGVRWL